MANRKMRMGMVGGGQGAFIGAVHRMAAGIDGEVELVCGAFSSDPKRSKASGKEFYLPAKRCYGSFKEMMDEEAKLPEGERMDFVSIVTPNFMHFPVAAAALKAGFHVICDKPMTFNLKEAKELKKIVKKSGKVFALTHNYTGYPLVKTARDMIAKGKLGKIRKVVVEYPQGWLATNLESEDQKQAAWRTDPKRAGISCCMGDIGTHAENLAEFMTGLEIDSMCADLTAYGKGRKLDDDGNVLLRFKGGAKGILHASQISVGEENGLNIRVYGEKGGLEWHQQEPNTLWAKWLDAPTQMIRAGSAGVSASGMAHTRLPAGHPEGYLEAFANIYRNFANTIRKVDAGKKPNKTDLDFPSVDDGIRGLAFIETVVKSSKSKDKWTKFIK